MSHLHNMSYKIDNYFPLKCKPSYLGHFFTYFSFYQIISSFNFFSMNLKCTLSLLIGVSMFVAKTYAQTSRVVSFNWTNVAQQLRKAPSETLQQAENQILTFSLPKPDGGERSFKVYDSPIMDAAFAREQPTFKTYKIIAVDNPQVMGRMMVSPFGLNATIMSEGGMVNIRPRDIKNPVLHEVYSGTEENGANTPFAACGFDPSKDPHQHVDIPRPEGVLGITNGGSRRTYRLAIVATGEFGTANGGAVAAAAVVTASVNAIQVFYDRELAVRFTLLTPFIYTNAATDPFDPATTTDGNGLTNQALEGVHMNFAVGTYDIGHVVHTPAGLGGSGVAGLGVVCDDDTNRSGGDNDALSGHNKAAGWSGSNPNNSLGWYNLFGHEIGHMFNMNHTFNGDGSNCATGNHSLNTAYEIASGTTIMSYQGICSAPYNIPGGGATNLYFHANSLESSIAYMSSKSCETTTATGNTPPVVNANPCGATYRIPIGTPFTLTGSATDANGDAVYYCWEQYDEDGTGVRPTHGKLGTAAAADVLAPLFRSYPPTTSPSRTIPAMSLVAANSYASDFEPLPSVARTLNFKLTARDWNSNGGGFSTGELAVTVTGAAFSVTAPNTAMSITAGSATTVTWNVGGGTYATNVAISLSIDEGLTYPYVLLASTANDGSESVTIPSNVSNTTTARIKVEGSDGGNACVKFFDISDANFSITSSCIAASSNICPNNAVVSMGNTGLNLGLNKFFGGTITSKVLNVTAADPAVPSGIATTQGSTTCTNYGNDAHKSFDIAVTATGTYTFTVTPGMTNGFTAVSVFTSAGFNAATPCMGATFLGSNAYTTGGGMASNSGSFTVNLTACVAYKVMVYVSNDAYGNNTVAISGAGTVYEAGADPGASYGYTYVAVSTADNLIKVVNATGDFTGLAIGTYIVHGISYNTSLTPSSWVGQTIAQVVASGCLLVSTNNKPLAVTSTLPVELLRFSGKNTEGGNLLTWTTAEEKNVRDFDIERSLDGQLFIKIGTVKAKGSSSNYTLIDPTTAANVHYYRLKINDLNGTADYSKVITLSNSSKNQLKVYPSVTRQFLTVETTEETDFQVYNLLGQQVLTGKISDTPPLWIGGLLDVSAFPQGTYILKVGTQVAKFVKQ